MPSEAKALGNARDTLTEGGYSGWLGYSIKARALWHTFSDVVKASCPNSAFAKRPILVTEWAVLMTTARMLRSRVVRKRHARI